MVFDLILFYEFMIMKFIMLQNRVILCYRDVYYIYI